ncbi:acetoacetate decarboxylase family protein [Companilactobacillus mishanensis]|uniref:Acetoacetate decarboxylase n=1 Tax=Companilactobacillus mishanensis TaxID=2486008 RepID=A0A5P0ZHS8_9LACO|nr:acetoacetate decarboxylase family protein [Companilactobacillus mishanensis]MQS45132.1 acetoacetate decarboxylase [Companilactobacillus mishanensis]MQS52613.1 acetoacetate decarboxylase [Companilactobacillus mishanensis]MQS90195.1 acetoacetate decarboxylase [Companilactobacillus mishanensis]
MASFLVPDDDVKNFLTLPSMNDQEGIMFAYAAPEKVLKKLLPKPLKLVAPVICGYTVQMGKPSFGRAYMEAVLYVLANYDDKMIGAYPFNLMLHGPGAEEGVIAGREGAGIPKKLADKFEIRRNDNSATAIVERHGTRLMELSWEKGDYNEPDLAHQVFDAQSVLNSQAETSSFFYTWDMDQVEDGSNVFSNVKLVATQSTTVTDSFEPGKLSIKLNSSDDDPFGELKVLKPLGAAWYHVDTSVMHNTLKLADVDAKKTMPYLLTGRYDRSMMNPKVNTFII